MYNWELIIIAIFVSNIFRLIPFFIIKLTPQWAKKIKWETFFNYAACAMIGCLIYGIAFNYRSLDVLWQMTGLTEAYQCLMLVIAFMVSLYFKSPLLAFFLCISIYAALLCVMRV